MKVSKQAQKEIEMDTPLRNARSCYGHLAGVSGVALAEYLINENWIEINDGEKPDITITDVGVLNFSKMDIDLDFLMKAKSRFGYGCLDWTEKKFHIAGALGAELLKHFKKNRILRSNASGRILEILQDPVFHLNQIV